MTRDEVFTLVRDHLADELELDGDRISEATRFKEDLEADSLDLYTLVQELEDSYGVRISDEDAAILAATRSRGSRHRSDRRLPKGPPCECAADRTCAAPTTSIHPR